MTSLFRRCYKGARAPAQPMSIDPELLSMLACPVCRAAVEPTPEGTALLCRACRRRYPIVDDIPVLLVEEAVVEPEGRS